MKIIVNADDFGLSKGVNEGIIDAHTNGVVTRTTLLMNGPAVNHAVELAKRTPSLKVGIHLALSFGSPLNKAETHELVDQNGKFKFTSLEQTLTPSQQKQVEIEWRTQIEAFLETGLQLDHIDSHHHIHGWKDLKYIVLSLSKEYDVPVRYVETLQDSPANLLTEYLWLDFYKDGIKENVFDEIIKLPYNSVEIMTHPAVVDTALKQLSSYTEDRERETALLKTIKPPAELILI